MLLNLARLSRFGIVAAIMLGFTATQGHSEIAVPSGQSAPKVGAAAQAEVPPNERPTQDSSLWVQCWQVGVKIIDEKNISGIRLRNLIEQESVGFSGRDSNDRGVYVIPVSDNSTCLVKSLR